MTQWYYNKLKLGVQEKTCIYFNTQSFIGQALAQLAIVAKLDHFERLAIFSIFK